MFDVFEMLAPELETDGFLKKAIRVARFLIGLG